MEKIQNKSRISKMLASGRINYEDPKNGYIYSLCAVCPNDGYDSPVTSFDRDTVASTTRISRVTFLCPDCGTRFSARAGDMFLK